MRASYRSAIDLLRIILFRIRTIFGFFFLLYFNSNITAASHFSGFQYLNQYFAVFLMIWKNFFISMNSFLQVKNLYDEPTSNSFLFLKQIDPLKGILEQRCLVFFLRYVENIPHMGALQVVKTLLLWCRLCRVDHAKMARLTAENEAPMWQDVKSKIDKGSTYGIIYKKMVDFHRAVTSAESSVPTEEQIEVLTRDLHKLKQLGESEEGSWGRMSDILYWLAQEELYRLWVHIQDQLPYFMSYDSSKFEVFYQQYCLFCTHRRKVPIIRHKMLKSVRINIYINQQIEQKSKEVKERSKGYVFRLKRDEGIVDFCEDSDQE